LGWNRHGNSSFVCLLSIDVCQTTFSHEFESRAISCPTELLKIRQQTILTSKLPSTFQLARSIGLKGLYRGALVTSIRDSGYGIYFATYEAASHFLRPRPLERDKGMNHSSLIQEAEYEISTLSLPRLMVAGGLAGVVRYYNSNAFSRRDSDYDDSVFRKRSWLLTFPLDVVKTRIQSTTSNRYQYRTTIAHIYQIEGFQAFFAGLTPTLIRCVPFLLSP
jgi:solute carrier family 25 carnitine/acylcarnitine transporter 20/29